MRAQVLNAASFQGHLCKHLCDIILNIYELDIVFKVMSQAPPGVN